MKLWLLIPLLIGSLFTAQADDIDRYSGDSFAGQQCIAPTDKDPWPWGAECPFPWENVSGTWKMEPAGETLSYGKAEYIKISILSIFEDNSRFFEFKRYDSDGNLTALGTGTASAGEKVIRAVLRGKKGTLPQFVVLRTYKDDAEAEYCTPGKIVKAISISTKHCSDEDDRHYSLEPVN